MYFSVSLGIQLILPSTSRWPASEGGVIVLQVVKHHGDAGVFGFSRSLRL